MAAGIFLNGKFWECGEYEHDKLAEKLVNKYYRGQYDAEETFTDYLDFLVFRCHAYKIGNAGKDDFVVYFGMNCESERVVCEIKNMLDLPKMKEIVLFP